MIALVTKARVLRAATIFRKRRISQAEVAEIVGASQPQISRILKGGGIRASKLAEEVCLYAEKLEGGVSARSARRRSSSLLSAGNAGVSAQVRAIFRENLFNSRKIRGQIIRH